MRSYLFAATLLLATGAAFAQTPPAAPPIKAVSMTLSSSDFQDGGILPDQFTSKVNVAGQPPKAMSPALSWTGTPAGTQSFVLIMHDLDVVVGKGTDDNLHWLAWNIPGTATSLPQNVPTTATLADGTVQLRRGNAPNYAYGFSGPGAPAPIYHHYVFEIWALDSKLTLPESATRADVLKAMDGHVLDKGMIVARFHR
jgi:Raf kinase inhibitor-like YbhB/YbcL family protein